MTAATLRELAIAAGFDVGPSPDPNSVVVRVNPDRLVRETDRLHGLLFKHNVRIVDFHKQKPGPKILGVYDPFVGDQAGIVVSGLDPQGAT